jgi:hypothetical protein
MLPDSLALARGGGDGLTIHCFVYVVVFRIPLCVRLATPNPKLASKGVCWSGVCEGVYVPHIGCMCGPDRAGAKVP